MCTRVLYRYDTRDFIDGAEIRYNGDHYDRLNKFEQAAEMALRHAHRDGFEIRSTSVYAYESEKMGMFAWHNKKDAHLYEVEVFEEDVLHTGDLQHYTRLVAALRMGVDERPFTEAYWSGKRISDRIEVLASRATVLRRLKHKDEPKNPVVPATESIEDILDSTKHP